MAISAVKEHFKNVGVYQGWFHCWCMQSSNFGSGLATPHPEPPRDSVFHLLAWPHHCSNAAEIEMQDRFLKLSGSAEPPRLVLLQRARTKPAWGKEQRLQCSLKVECSTERLRWWWCKAASVAQSSSSFLADLGCDLKSGVAAVTPSAGWEFSRVAEVPRRCPALGRWGLVASFSVSC